MLNRVHHLDGCAVTATDGAVGHVKDALFDDAKWAIRYLAVDIGNWLSTREVLVSPYAIRQPLSAAANLDLRLSRTQILHSPGIDARKPASRDDERAVLAYYGYPDYRNEENLWATGGYPDFPPRPAAPKRTAAGRAAGAEGPPAADAPLHSCARLKGCAIHASDGSMGQLDDFLFDDESWAIRYVVAATRDGWTGGRKVLIAPYWIDRIDREGRSVHVNLTLQQVKTSPVYDDSSPVHRDYEERLHSAYDRTGHWD
jgi:hypothetical protein